MINQNINATEYKQINTEYDREIDKLEPKYKNYYLPRISTLRSILVCIANCVGTSQLLYSGP